MNDALPGGLESRVARVEAHVEHIQSDVSEVKLDIRELAKKVDHHFVMLLTFGGGAVALMLGAIAKGFRWL